MNQKPESMMSAADAVSDVFATMRQMRNEGRAAVADAKPALQRICAAMSHRTNQSYHLRALLFSLWNGKATSLLEVVNLDRSLRQDFCAVLLAFGFGDGQEEFFYDAIKAALIDAGQFQWFVEESEVTA